MLDYLMLHFCFKIIIMRLKAERRFFAEEISYLLLFTTDRHQSEGACGVCTDRATLEAQDCDSLRARIRSLVHLPIQLVGKTAKENYSMPF